MAGKRSLEAESRWRELVARQAASGLTVREFCRREGISENSLYSWRRELPRRKQRKIQMSRRMPQPTEEVAGPDFIPVQVRGSAAAIELVHPLGYQIRIDGRLEPQMLRQLLDVLEQRGEA